MTLIIRSSIRSSLKQTKSTNEGDDSTSESIIMNKKSCPSYEVTRGKPTQNKSYN